jgi:hypothetical protein
MPFLTSRLNSPQNWFSSLVPEQDIASGNSGSAQTQNDYVYRIYSHRGVVSGFSFVGSPPSLRVDGSDWTIVQDGTNASGGSTNPTLADLSGESFISPRGAVVRAEHGSNLSVATAVVANPNDTRYKAYTNVPFGWNKKNGGCGYKAGRAKLYRNPQGGLSAANGYAAGSIDIEITILPPQPYIALSLADVVFNNSYGDFGHPHAINLKQLTALEAGWRDTTLDGEALAYPIEPSTETTVGGDARKVYFAIIDWLAQSYLNIPSEDRPSKVTVFKSTTVAATTGILTTNYNFQFKLVSTGLEVQDEIPLAIGNAPNG